jgi:hypothetical protein
MQVHQCRVSRTGLNYRITNIDRIVYAFAGDYRPLQRCLILACTPLPRNPPTLSSPLETQLRAYWGDISLTALHETIDHPFLAGLLKIHRQLVAFDLRHVSVAELLVEDPVTDGVAHRARHDCLAVNEPWR